MSIISLRRKKIKVHKKVGKLLKTVCFQFAMICGSRGSKSRVTIKPWVVWEERCRDGNEGMAMWTMETTAAICIGGTQKTDIWHIYDGYMTRLTDVLHSLWKNSQGWSCNICGTLNVTWLFFSKIWFAIHDTYWLQLATHSQMTFPSFFGSALTCLRRPCVPCGGGLKARKKCHKPNR